MQGHSPRRSCPCGQTLALPASPHVSRVFVVRIHSRSKTHRRTHMTQTNGTEPQSATTERKARGWRRNARAAAAATDSGATAVHQVADTTQATHGVSTMNTQARGTEILNGTKVGNFVFFG